MRFTRLAMLTIAVLLPAVTDAQVKRGGLERGAAAPAPVADSLPGTPVVRTDPRTGSPQALGARRLLLSGAVDLSWSPDSGETALTDADAIRLASVSDGAGGKYCAWAEARSGEFDIYVQRFGLNGDIAPNWPEAGIAVCAASGSQHHVDLAPDGEGGLFVVWEDLRSGDADIYLARIRSDGQPAEGWPEGGREVCVAAAYQGVPRLVRDGAGGAFVIWLDRRSEPGRVFAARVNAFGDMSPGWLPGGAPISDAGCDRGAPVLASTSDGVVIAVRQECGAEGRTLVAARLDDWTPGSASPAGVVLAAGATEFGEIAVAPSGSGLLVSWSEWKEGGASLRAQRLSLGPGLSADWQPGGREICAGEVSRGAPVLTSDGAGGAVIAWQDLRSGNQSEIFAQRLTATGEIAPGWPESGVALCLASGDQYAPKLATADTLALVMTWEDAAASTQAMLLAAGSGGSQSPRLLRTNARPGRATIVWSAVGSSTPLFTAFRRVGEGEWVRLAEVVVDDSLHVVLDDRTAPEGSRVAYRLGNVSEQRELFYEEVSLEIPGAPLVLGLHFARVARGERAIRVAFALPRGVDARLDLMDVAGRRVTTQSLAGLEPGEHEVRFSLSGRVPAGVYFVRLIQAREARTAKVVYLR